MSSVSLSTPTSRGLKEGKGWGELANLIDVSLSTPTSRGLKEKLNKALEDVNKKFH